MYVPYDIPDPTKPPNWGVSGFWREKESHEAPQLVGFGFLYV
jgi:hypothetical protein